MRTSMYLAAVAAWLAVVPATSVAAAPLSAAAEADAVAKPLAITQEVLPAKPQLIKETATGQIYLKISEEVVAPITDTATVQRLAPQVTPVSVKDVLKKYRTDSAITPERVKPNGTIRPAIKPVNLNNRVIKEPTKPTVYVVTTCSGKPVLRPIINWSSFEQLMFKPENIEPVSAEAIKQLAVGKAIDAQNLTLQYGDERAVLKKTAEGVTAYRNEVEFFADGKTFCDDMIKLPPRVVPLPTPSAGEAVAPRWGASNENFIDISVFTPPDYGYGYGLPGVNQGFVALKPNQPALYRAAEGTAWQKSAMEPTQLKDSLQLCQKYFPGTYLAQSMSNYNFRQAWIKYAGLPEGGWYLFSCLKSPAATGTQASGATPESNDLGAVSYWWGKVNRHSAPSVLTMVGAVEWPSDPDGSSGASLDTLTYCQKWYPAAQSVQYIGNTGVDDWKDAGLRNSWKGGGSTYACRAAAQPTITVNAEVTPDPIQPIVTPAPAPIELPQPTPTVAPARGWVYPWDH